MMFSCLQILKGKEEVFWVGTHRFWATSVVIAVKYVTQK